ncbi:hypothetical protein D3260_08210 [Salinisphaera sp. Q1T1-3]|nr:hypothetical protein D3260_08210 [Salinisphaera sp. Q1T1-3]
MAWLALLVVTVGGAVAGYRLGQPALDGLDVVTQTKRFAPDGCRQSCPTVRVETLHFAAAPHLQAQLRQRLLATAGRSSSDGAGPPPDYARYANRLFAADAAARRADPTAPPYHAVLRARLVDTHDGLAVVELDTDVYLGGAHDIAGRAFLVIDTRTRAVLTLADLLRPGRRAAFEQRLHTRYRQWRDEKGMAPDTGQFTPDGTVALLAGDVAVAYPAGEIAPVRFGAPVLHIDYDRLRDILKPRFLPDADE